MKKRASSFLAYCFVCIIVFGVKVGAQSSTVGPAYLRMRVSSAAMQTKAAITITNDSKAPQEYEVTVVDVDIDTGSLVPLARTSAKNAQLFSVEKSAVAVGSMQKQELSVTATNFDSLAPGGHYAGVQIRQKTTTSTNAQVPLQQAIVVGLFLTKEDGAARSATLLSEPPKGVQFTLPSTQNIQLRNDGNVDITPRGFYALSRGTQEIAKVQFNETSRPIFAGKTQTYVAGVTFKKFLMPGKYTVYVSYRADADQLQQVVKSTFWYMPLWFVVIVGGVVMLLLVKLLRSTRRTTKQFVAKKTKTAAVISADQEVANTQAVEPPKRITIKVVAEEAITKPKRARKKATKKSKKSTKKKSINK